MTAAQTEHRKKSFPRWRPLSLFRRRRVQTLTTSSPPPPSSLDLAERHLSAVAAHFEGAKTSAASRSYRRQLAHYYNLLIPASASVLEIGCGDGELLALINASQKTGVDLCAGQL